MPGHHHRAGALKQTNKKNKRSKASKRSLSRNAGGKINASSHKGADLAALSKASRRNQAAQKRREKKQELMRQRRGISLNTEGELSGNTLRPPSVPPRMVGILSLSPTNREDDVRTCLRSMADSSSSDTTTNTVTCAYHKFQKTMMNQLSFVTTQSFLLGTTNDTNDHNDDDAAVVAALDMARVCDVLLFVVADDASVKDPLHQEISLSDDNQTTTTTNTAKDFDHLISERGDRILAALKGQGLPTPVTLLVLQKYESTGTFADSKPSDNSIDAMADNNDDLDFLEDDEDDHMTFHTTMSSAKSLRRSHLKRRQQLKRFMSRFAATEFGAHNDKVLELQLPKSNDMDLDLDGTTNNKTFTSNVTAATVIRTLCTMSCSPAKWVSSSVGGGAARPYLVTDDWHYDSASRQLHLTGYIRGRGTPWDCHSLVHVPNVGTFACVCMSKEEEPLRKRRNRTKQTNNKDEQMQDTNDKIFPDPTRQENLEMFASPDALEGEQNLIGFDEDDGHIDEEEEDAVERPAGWSDYQSAWLDAVDKDVGYDDGAVDHGELAEALNQKTTKSLASDDMLQMDVDDANDVSPSERQALLEQRRKDQSEHQEFPDEVEVDEDVKAQDRFARYRSLKSFRKSYWDPKESLPESFASIYNFNSFKATQRSIMNDVKDMVRAAERANGQFWGKTNLNESTPNNAMEADSDEDDDLLQGCVPSGSYVTLTLGDVPEDAMHSIAPSLVLTAVSLLPHENKVSVLHMGLTQSSSCDVNKTIPIKSKDVLTFRCGWRTWKSRPVFSQNNLNCDKHKFERYMPQNGCFFAASIFGPVTYTPCPVLVFRENGSKRELVAVGSMLGADSDRIVIKRIVLTGYPVRVHKRHATVKYMFYNPEDVKWFKPAGLYTKHGLQGNIVESVGEHGTMKCLFNAPIKQHDTVCLPLYKRIFPKYVQADERKGTSIGPGAKPVLAVR